MCCGQQGGKHSKMFNRQTNPKEGALAESMTAQETEMFEAGAAASAHNKVQPTGSDSRVTQLQEGNVNEMLVIREVK